MLKIDSITSHLLVTRAFQDTSRDSGRDESCSLQRECQELLTARSWIKAMPWEDRS